MGEAIIEILLQIVIEIVGDILGALIEGSFDLFERALDKVTTIIYPCDKEYPSSDFSSELRATSLLFFSKHSFKHRVKKDDN